MSSEKTAGIINFFNEYNGLEEEQRNLARLDFNYIIKMEMPLIDELSDEEIIELKDLKICDYNQNILDLLIGVNIDDKNLKNKLVLRLIKSGFEVNNSGLFPTCLQMSASQCNVEIVRALLEAGANTQVPYTRDNTRIVTPLRIMFNSGERTSIMMQKVGDKAMEIVELLVKYGVDINNGEISGDVFKVIQSKHLAKMFDLGFDFRQPLCFMGGGSQSLLDAFTRNDGVLKSRESVFKEALNLSTAKVFSSIAKTCSNGYLYGTIPFNNMPEEVNRMITDFACGVRGRKTFENFRSLVASKENMDSISAVRK